MVTKSDGRGDCVGLGGFEPGHGDAYYNNTCALPGMSGESGKVGGVPCDPQQVDMHGARTSGHFFVARNLCRAASLTQWHDIICTDNSYFTAHGNASLGSCGLVAGLYASKGMEQNSVSEKLPSDEELVAWAKARLE